MSIETDRLVRTRHSLHAVAEHVLAAARYEATGRIGLRATPGGFATPPFEDPDGVIRVLRVEGTELVIDTDDGEHRTPLTTVGAAADFAGIPPGGPAEVYELATPLDPDAPLDLDEAAVVHLARFFAIVDAALSHLRARHTDDDPAIEQLWPEHFDVATSFHEINFGGSPGDAEHSQPYLYVGPWDRDGLSGPEWNEPFGRSLIIDDLPSVADALAFFEQGLADAGTR